MVLFPYIPQPPPPPPPNQHTSDCQHVFLLFRISLRLYKTQNRTGPYFGGYGP